MHYAGLFFCASYGSYQKAGKSHQLVSPAASFDVCPLRAAGYLVFIPLIPETTVTDSDCCALRAFAYHHYPDHRIEPWSLVDRRKRISCALYTSIEWILPGGSPKATSPALFFGSNLQSRAKANKSVLSKQKEPTAVKQLVPPVPLLDSFSVGPVRCLGRCS